MTDIRPISDLRNKFAEISKTVHESGEPVILTKNGYGNMVVMSYDAYSQLRYEADIAACLREADKEAAMTDVRYSHDEVFAGVRETIKAAKASDGL